MSLPKYDVYDLASQRLFYSELRRQLDNIEKIEDRRERSRKMSRLKIDIYNAVSDGKKLQNNKKSFLRSIFDYLKQVIINLINRIKK